MNQEIIEGNKIIAEFMGGEVVEISPLFGQRYLQVNTENMQSYNSLPKLINPKALRYHKSYDELMPVVEKIEENDEIDVNILLNGTRIFKWRTDEDIVNNVANISFDRKIEHIYWAIVEYLKKGLEV